MSRDSTHTHSIVYQGGGNGAKFVALCEVHGIMDDRNIATQRRIRVKYRGKAVRLCTCVCVCVFFEERSYMFLSA